MINKKSSFFVCFALTLANSLAETLNPSRFALPERFAGNNESIFRIFSDLHAKYDPLDFGQGAPDYNAPKTLRNALADAITRDDHSMSQYAPDLGHPRLLNAIAEFYSNLLNRTLDPNNNVIVTVGATEALYLTFQTHTFPGDEWIIFEPFFAPYVPIIKAAHGVPRFATLRPKNSNCTTKCDDWTFDRDELASLFNEKTKGILFNNPHNPIGKVFTREEIEYIAHLAKKWDTLVVADEVYEFLVFDGKEHIRMATLPGMFDRTITVGSAGKSFSATGLRVGWAYGGAQILQHLRFIHVHVVMCVPTAIQEAVAIMFEEELENFGKPYSYLNTFKTALNSKRDYIAQVFTEVGMAPVLPDAGYFMVVNWTPLSDKINLDEETDVYNDFRFAKWMIKNIKIQALPLSAFYSEESRYLGENGIRLTIAKKDETLKEAAEKLFKWKSKQ